MAKRVNKGGRPPHTPTDKERRIVELLVGYGIPARDVAKAIGVGSTATLYKHYRPQIEGGAAKVHGDLVMNLHRIARGSNAAAVRAIIFTLQARFGWSIYAPPKEAPLGKKEEARLAAIDAHAHAVGKARELRAAQAALVAQHMAMLSDPAASPKAKAIARFFLTADKDPEKAQARLATELIAARSLSG